MSISSVPWSPDITNININPNTGLVDSCDFVANIPPQDAYSFANIENKFSAGATITNTFTTAVLTNVGTPGQPNFILIQVAAGGINALHGDVYIPGPTSGDAQAFVYGWAGTSLGESFGGPVPNAIPVFDNLSGFWESAALNGDVELVNASGQAEVTGWYSTALDETSFSAPPSFAIPLFTGGRGDWVAINLNGDITVVDETGLVSVTGINGFPAEILSPVAGDAIVYNGSEFVNRPALAASLPTTLGSMTIDFNLGETDQAFTISAIGSTFGIDSSVVNNASSDMSSVDDVEIWTGAGRTGTKLWQMGNSVTSISPGLSMITGPGLFIKQSLISTPVGKAFTETTIYVSIGTPQGAPVTANLYLNGFIFN